MKMKTCLLLATAGALSCAQAGAQSDASPPAPPPPPAAPAPPVGGPPPEGLPPFHAPDRGLADEKQEIPPPGDRGDRRFPGYGNPGMRRDGERPGMPGSPGMPGMPGRGYGMGDGAPARPQPYIGVMSVPVPTPLGAQLGLAPGFGLLLADVLPDSPAAKAGLQKFDVLKLLNDQQLVHPEQLEALIRGRGKDQEVTLTLIRKSQEQKVTVKIGERMTAPASGPMGQGGGMSPQQWQERLHNMPDGMRQHFEEWKKEHGAGEAPFGRPQAGIAPEDILREARPGGGNQITTQTESSVSTMDGAQSHLLFKDNDGAVEVSSANGKRTITARDAQGKTLFSGPVDTPEQRGQIPARIREKLDQIRLRSQGPGAHPGGGPSEAERLDFLHQAMSAQKPDSSPGVQ